MNQSRNLMSNSQLSTAKIRFSAGNLHYGFHCLNGWSALVLDEWSDYAPLHDLDGWMKEKLLFPDDLQELAAGKELDGLWLAERLTGEKDAAAQDRVSDYRLLRLLRKVISPGRAARSDLRIFASRLLLYPSFYDKMFGGISHGCTFREAAELFSEDPEVRMVASRKAREVPLHAIGKGEELQQASLAYMEFLQALSRGEKVARLLELLDAADMKFGLAEEAVRKREEGK